MSKRWRKEETENGLGDVGRKKERARGGRVMKGWKEEKSRFGGKTMKGRKNRENEEERNIEGRGFDAERKELQREKRIRGSGYNKRYGMVKEEEIPGNT